MKSQVYSSSQISRPRCTSTLRPTPAHTCTHQHVPAHTCTPARLCTHRPAPAHTCTHRHTAAQQWVRELSSHSRTHWCQALAWFWTQRHDPHTPCSQSWRRQLCARDGTARRARGHGGSAPVLKDSGIFCRAGTEGRASLSCGRWRQRAQGFGCCVEAPRWPAGAGTGEGHGCGSAGLQWTVSQTERGRQVQPAQRAWG